MAWLFIGYSIWHTGSNEHAFAEAFFVSLLMICTLSAWIGMHISMFTNTSIEDLKSLIQRETMPIGEQVINPDLFTDPIEKARLSVMEDKYGHF